MHRPHPSHCMYRVTLSLTLQWAAHARTCSCTRQHVKSFFSFSTARRAPPNSGKKTSTLALIDRHLWRGVDGQSINAVGYRRPRHITISPLGITALAAPTAPLTIVVMCRQLSALHARHKPGTSPPAQPVQPPHCACAQPHQPSPLHPSQPPQCPQAQHTLLQQRSPHCRPLAPPLECLPAGSAHCARHACRCRSPVKAARTRLDGILAGAVPPPRTPLAAIVESQTTIAAAPWHHAGTQQHRARRWSVPRQRQRWLQLARTIVACMVERTTTHPVDRTTRSAVMAAGCAGCGGE
jgi:hypothetical protein